MKKFTGIFLIVSVFFVFAYSESGKHNPSKVDDSEENPLLEKLLSHKWNMMMNDQSYGTIVFSEDGNVVKTAEGGGLETEGTWKLEKNILTIHFPSEGDAMSGKVAEDGENITVAFMDGAITWTYTPIKEENRIILF